MHGGMGDKEPDALYSDCNRRGRTEGGTEEEGGGRREESESLSRCPPTQIPRSLYANPSGPCARIRGRATFPLQVASCRTKVKAKRV